MPKTYRTKSRKTTTKKQKKRGGMNYKIGKKDKYGDTFGNNLIELGPPVNEPLPQLHITNLAMVSIFPNTDPGYKYHSFLVASIDTNTTFNLETINWAIENYLNKILAKIKESSPNENKINLNNIKINDFKIELKPEIKTIILSGNIYTVDAVKTNKQIQKNVYDKMPDDTNNIIKSYI